MATDIEDKKYKIVENYKDVSKRMLKLSFPALREQELEEALDYSISKRLKNNDVKLYNNYSNKTVKLNILDMCDYILERKPILTSYGVLFSQRGVKPNPIAKLLETFIEGRKVYKKQMYASKTSEDFEKFNLLQLLAKLDANGRQKCRFNKRLLSNNSFNCWEVLNA